MSVAKRKYLTWGDFLKKHRSGKYRSARDFCTRVQVGISYPQYSRYEAGDQLPNLDQALKLCHFLEIPFLEGLLEWSKAQIQDDASIQSISQVLNQLRTSGSVLADIDDTNAPTGVGIFTEATIPLDDVIVFNRAHLNLFQSNPKYRDIFTYINSYAPEWVKVAEIGQALTLEPAETEQMVGRLNDLGVIRMDLDGQTNEKRCRAAKPNFYFPDDADFFELRNLNIKHNMQSIMSSLNYDDVSNRKAYRSVITRELTSDQLEKTIQMIEKTMTKIIGQPETNKPDEIYSICFLLGKRFERARLGDSKKDIELPGLKTDQAPESNSVQKQS